MAHIQADKRAEKSTALPKIDRTYRVVSCGQPFIGQPLADYGQHKAVQPLQGVTAHVADVQAERELVHIAMQVLLGNLMINAIHAALEHSPDGFNAVRADAVLAVLPSGVVDAIVTKEQTIREFNSLGYSASA